MRVFQQKLILNSQITPIFLSCFSCTRAVAVSFLCRDGWICPIYGECIFMSKMCNMLLYSLLYWNNVLLYSLLYIEVMPNILLIDQKFELLSNVKAMKRKSIAIKIEVLFWRLLGALIFWFFFLFSLTRGNYTELLYQQIHFKEDILSYYRKFINSLTVVFSAGE